MIAAPDPATPKAMGLAILALLLLTLLAGIDAA